MSHMLKKVNIKNKTDRQLMEYWPLCFLAYVDDLKLSLLMNSVDQTGEDTGLAYLLTYSQM